MRTIIFGGAGFIGTNLVEALRGQENTDLLVVDNLSMGNQLGIGHIDAELLVADMADYLEVSAVMRKFKPDRVFHLAANSDISASAIDPKADLLNTLMTSTSLARAIQEHPVKELVFASSSAIFGAADGRIGEDTLANPISSYGWMKLASEYVLNSLSAEGLVDKFLCVRFPNVTGKWQTHGVVKDLVRKLKQSPSELSVLGDGTQTKPYALASDLVLAILQLLRRDWKGNTTVNLSPSDRISVSEIVQILIEVSELTPSVKFAQGRSGWPGDVPEYSFDCSYAEHLLGNNPFSSSVDAIRTSVDWEWNFGYDASIKA